MVNEDELYQGYLAQVYQGAYSNVPYSLQEKAVFNKTQICITYGELLYPSIQKIMAQLAPTEQDVFLDLGSGLGKCALQVFMQSTVKKVMGIEASKVLHEQAQSALLQVRQDLPFLWENRTLIFECDNFLQTSWQDATLIYTCSTCFTRELLDAIGNKINQTPQIKKVLSLRPLPTIRLPLKKVFSVECSWDSALCYFYEV